MRMMKEIKWIKPNQVFFSSAKVLREFRETFAETFAKKHYFGAPIFFFFFMPDKEHNQEISYRYTLLRHAWKLQLEKPNCFFLTNNDN